MIIAVIELIKTLLLNFLTPLSDMLKELSISLIDLLIIKFADVLPSTSFLDTIAAKFKDIAPIITNVLDGLCYFIPREELFILFQLAFAWIGFKMIFATIVRGKSLIPTMGA